MISKDTSEKWKMDNDIKTMNKEYGIDFRQQNLMIIKLTMGFISQKYFMCE